MSSLNWLRWERSFTLQSQTLFQNFIIGKICVILVTYQGVLRESFPPSIIAGQELIGKILKVHEDVQASPEFHDSYPDKSMCRKLYECASELLVYLLTWKEGEDHAISHFEIWAILYAWWQWRTMDRIKILDEIEKLAKGTWAQQVEIGNYMKAISQGLWVVAVALYYPKGPTRIKEIEYWNVCLWICDKHLQGDLDKWWGSGPDDGEGPEGF